MDRITGNCLCGNVSFHCANRFEQFHLCHCSQCRKATGSAYAPNLFTAPDNIQWEKGEENIRRYNVPGRAISNAFCMDCGGALPYVSLTGKALVVPAGCLDGNPDIRPQAHIFWSERAPWFDEAGLAPRHDRFPDT